MAGFMDFFKKLKDEAGSVANGVGQVATSTLYGFDSAAKSAAGGLAGLIGNVTGNQSFQHAASDLNSQAAGERAFMNQNPVTQTAGRIGSFAFAPSAASNTLQGLGIGINTAGNVLGAGIRANPTLNNVANEAVLSPVGRNVISPLLTGLATPTLNRTGLSNVATTQNQAVYNNSTFKPLGIQPFQVAGQMAGDVLNYIPVGHTANILDAALKTGAIGALSGALEPANNTQAFLGNVASNALGAAAFGGALHGITHPIQTANLVQDIGSEGKALVKSASGQIYNADSINNFAKAYQQKTNTAFRSGIAQTIAASEGGDAKATALLRRQASAIVPHAADLSEKDLRDLMRVFVGHESSPQVVNRLAKSLNKVYSQGGFVSTDLLTGGLASKLDNQAADIRTVPAEQVVSDRSAMIEKAAAKGGPTPKIKELMASYQKGDQLPPIPVYEENGKYVLNKDGWNRYQAQKYLGVKDIQVEVQPKFAGTGTAKQALERAKAGNPSGAIDPNINVAHLNIPEEAKQQVQQDINLVKDKIAQKTGGVLSNQEAINLANQTNETLTSAVGREQTLAWEAKLLKARQVIAKAASSGEVTPEYLRALQAVKTQGTDIARKLQSFSIGADPKSVTAKDTILSALMDLGHKSDTLLQAAKGVDFNDARQATAFYRQFVKPTMGEYVDAIRYSSMLSSPNTHINNAFSNALNVGVVAPLEKTVTGVLDFAHSVVTGKPRTALASEGLTYTKGAVSNIHQAAQTFVDALRGKTAYTNLDTAHMPLGNSGVAAKLVGAADNVTRLLEASDQFFTTLAKEGQTAVLKARQAKGIKLSGDPGMLAAKDAAYRLFRQDLHDPTQGHVLDAIDTLTGQIQQARNSSNPVVKTVAKYTLPFVKTPMNIIKQGVEYSPLGLSTLPGAANKTEQLAKTIVGSSAMTATAMLVASGRTTWAAPTSAKQKDAFYAAGMQPYAVKVGNQWVSYTKLPPALGFPIAMVAALHDAQANGHLGDSQVNTVLTALAKTGQFFSDQSYLKSIGDLLATVQGDPTAFSKTISNYPTQIVPYRAALSWVERLVDPNQHMVDRGTDFLTQEFQQIAMQIPGLAATTPLRTDQAGNIVPNQNRAVNAFSPLKVTTANQANQAAYDYLQQQTQATRFANDVKKNPDLMNQYAQYQNSQTPNGTFDQQQLVLKYDKKVKDLLGAPSSTSALSKARNDTQRMSLGKSIVGDSLDGKIPQDQAVKLVGQLNLDPNELERQVIISLPDNEQAAYAYDAVTKSGANPQDLIDQKILTTSVVNSMLDQGLIDTPTADGLKTAIKAAGVKKGSVKASKPKAIKITTPKSQGKHVAFVSLSMPKGMAMTPPKLKPLTA